MLSQKARYALRALLRLAGNGRSTPVAAIAASENIPKKFLELILLELKSHGLVISHRGKAGGYELGRAPEDISFAEVMRIVDGPIALFPCASRTAFQLCQDCPTPETCAIREVLIDVREASARILETRTLASASTHIDDPKGLLEPAARM